MKSLNNFLNQNEEHFTLKGVGAEFFSSTRRLPVAARRCAIAHRGRAVRQACPEQSRREQRRNRKKEPPKCEDCSYSTPAIGGGNMVFTCDRKRPGHRLIVKPDDKCKKFVASRDLLAPHLAEALAEGAKLIPLTQGKFAIVDPENYNELSQYKWTAAKSPNTFYAVRSAQGRQIRMHRLITTAPKGLVVDHINHNGLDNRKQNLRLCTRSENARNQRPQTGRSSRYKGVCWHKNQKKWLARVYSNGVTYHLGSFKSQIDAAKAYDKKAKELFGQYAHLNFPNE